MQHNPRSPRAILARASVAHLAPVAIFGCLLILAGCSDRTSAGKSEDTGSSTTENTEATALGKATFSALIDGERVSGGAIDDMQQQNAAYTEPGSDGQPYLLFYLFDAKVPNDPNFSHSFRVYVPKRAGTASDGHLTLNVILDPNHSARYNASNASITIANLTSTRVSGTFSAKMNVSPDTPSAPKSEVTVTEGQFDIPMATSKIIPP